MQPLYAEGSSVGCHSSCGGMCKGLDGVVALGLVEHLPMEQFIAVHACCSAKRNVGGPLYSCS